VKKSLLRILAAVAAVAIAGYVFRGPLVRLLVLRPQSPPPGELGSTIAQVAPQGLTVVATGLESRGRSHFYRIPACLVTERPGRLVHIKGTGGRAIRLRVCGTLAKEACWGSRCTRDTPRIIGSTCISPSWPVPVSRTR